MLATGIQPILIIHQAHHPHPIPLPHLSKQLAKDQTSQNAMLATMMPEPPNIFHVDIKSIVLSCHILTDLTDQHTAS